MGKLGGMKAKRWLWVGLGVLGLAAVVFLGGALAKSDTPKPAPSTQLAPSIQADQLARDAQAALSKNDTATALSLAEKALKADPSNAAAAAVVAAAKAQPTPAEPTKPDSGDSSSKDDPYLSAVKDLKKLLPTKITGWEVGQVVEQSPDALVTYQPEAGSTDDDWTKRAVFSVHDLKTVTKAKDFVAKVDKVAYAKTPATLSVGVVDTAYFGTNESGTAMVAFARGRFAFEMLVVAEQGVDPVALKDTATALAAAFPAAK